jgi:hypothetical protein
MRSSQPGDAIICNHPSFYFYAHYELSWPQWYDVIPDEPIEESGREFVPLSKWQEVVARHNRIIYVRSVLMPEQLDADNQLMLYLGRNYRLVSERRYLKDEAAGLKRRFYQNQPLWRIEILAFERQTSGVAPLGGQSAESEIHDKIGISKSNTVCIFVNEKEFKSELLAYESFT